MSCTALGRIHGSGRVRRAGRSEQAFSAQEVRRDEVNGADRIARADEGAANWIGQDTLSEAVAHVLPRRQVQIGDVLAVGAGRIYRRAFIHDVAGLSQLRGRTLRISIAAAAVLGLHRGTAAAMAARERKLRVRKRRMGGLLFAGRLKHGGQAGRIGIEKTHSPDHRVSRCIAKSKILRPPRRSHERSSNLDDEQKAGAQERQDKIQTRRS